MALSFTSYQSLLKCAELQMGGTPREMLAVFRQLYYGKPWSNNTASQWDQVIPCSPDIGDPRARLDPTLFESLKASQSVGGVDFGHVFAGLEAMTCPGASVTPKVSSRAGWMKKTAGGAAKVLGLTTVMTANEDFATWAGDLGSAVAAKHACSFLDADGKDEARNSANCGDTAAVSRLDYYLELLADSEDLEGDIDPFVLRAHMLGIPCGRSRLKTLTIGSHPISDMFRRYYQDDPSRWRGGARAGRATCFLETLGGVFGGGARLTNANDVAASITPPIASFANAFYKNMVGGVKAAKESLPFIRNDFLRMTMEVDARKAADWFVERLQWRR